MAAVAVPVRRPARRAGDRAVVPAGPWGHGASLPGPSLPDSSGTFSSGLRTHAVFHAGCVQGHFSELHVARTTVYAENSSNVNCGQDLFKNLWHANAANIASIYMSVSSKLSTHPDVLCILEFHMSKPQS